MAVLAVALAPAVRAVGVERLVLFSETRDALRLVSRGVAAPIVVDPEDHAGVRRAAGDLREDVARVTGVRPALEDSQPSRAADVVVVGTLGKSRLIDSLVRAGKLDVREIQGRWESSVLQVVARPWRGVERALVIAGSDKRGTIFGVYDVSEQIGVSPWYWWADVPVRHRDQLFVRPGRSVRKEPVVKYRGLFINDEAPALSGWAREKFGGFNHAFYVKVFELLLRLRANFLWPAMWGSAFADDDAENPRLADEYGIVVSTSHHEPLMRAHDEWRRYGRGPWNYATNADALRSFWAEGLRRTKDYEKLVTLGMRGDGDEPMSREANVALLERIVADQRGLVREIQDPDVTRVPQVWALYKEVQEYYEKGMRVPDDVTLLWCDDNWGNIRRLPTPLERGRPGGAGVYYHFDYVGGPRSYKWLNTVPIPKIWEQMHLAYRYGATRLWVVNVGDKDAFYQLVLHPTKASAVVNDLYVTVGRNRLFAVQGRASTNDLAARARELFQEDARLSHEYNEVLAGGKWNHLMDQTHIGYTFWNQPVRNAMPGVQEVQVEEAPELAVAVEGSEASWPGSPGQPVLPALNVFDQQPRFVEVFNRGQRPFDFSVEASEPWLQVDVAQGSVTREQRVSVSARWDSVPIGAEGGSLAVSGPNGARVVVKVPVVNPETPRPEALQGFVEANGYVSIEAEHFGRSVAPPGRRWLLIPDHGRTLSGMTPLPVTAATAVGPVDGLSGFRTIDGTVFVRHRERECPCRSEQKDWRPGSRPSRPPSSGGRPSSKACRPARSWFRAPSLARRRSLPATRPRPFLPTSSSACSTNSRSRPR